MKKRGLLLAAVGMALAVPTAASANGPCGNDFDGAHACGINSPANIGGALVTSNETDYYVFHATKGTELAVQLTDTEDPSCSTSSDSYCGGLSAALDDSSGNDITDSGWSEPNNGITVPADLDYTIQSSGTYYLILSGNLGEDQNGNPTQVPYNLQVNASPNVQWPPPPKGCKVPGFKVGESLSKLESRLVFNHCAVGTIIRKRSRHVRKGRVIALKPKPGAHLAHAAPVTIYVSKGRR